MTARGVRPVYRVRAAGASPEIHLSIVELPWLRATATRPPDIATMARALVADWLEVDEAEVKVELDHT